MQNLLTNHIRRKNLSAKVNLKTRLGRNTSGGTTMRWVFFLSAAISCFILTSFKEPVFQAIGWGLSGISCLGWVLIAVEDKDIPRCLMELMYSGFAFWGLINWLR